MLFPFPKDMIHELEPITNKFISVPPDLGQLDCAAYIAGIVRGVLQSGGFVRAFEPHNLTKRGSNSRVFFVFFLFLCSCFGFQPARVTAHAVEVGNGQRDKTVFLVKFDENVIKREKQLT